MNISQEAMDAANDIENAYRESALQDTAFIARRIQAAIDASVKLAKARLKDSDATEGARIAALSIPPSPVV